MSDDNTPQRGRSWIFIGFLVGVAVGATFGLLAASAWGEIGPYQSQISVGFWGILGGIFGSMFGLVYGKMKT
jgi:hypothetical protein